MITKKERIYLLSHCEVAVLVAKLPRNTAVDRHFGNAIRMATLNAIGKRGISYASERAAAKKTEMNADWYKCKLIREHVIPVSFIMERVREHLAKAYASDLDGQVELSLPLLINGETWLDQELAIAQRTPQALQVADVVRYWSVMAWVHPDDDKKLKEFGFRDCMPPDWTENEGRFARYDRSGIKHFPIN